MWRGSEGLRIGDMMAWSIDKEEDEQIQAYDKWLSGLSDSEYRQMKSDYYNTCTGYHDWPDEAEWLGFKWNKWRGNG